jgi:4-aminobutyrate aminotransferase
VVEPIQGEGGYVIPPEGFLEWLRDVTMQHGLLLVVDEVQSGVGRTGRMFAFQHSAIEPDVVIMGKALGGGLPVSAIAARRELMEAWPAGTHGTTFGGNPLACATGLATLKAIEEEGLLNHVATLGQLALEILTPLKSLSAIADIRGRGLMIAVEFAGPNGPELVAQIMRQALEKHILLHSAGLRHEVIRFMPPLNIDRDLFIEGLRTVVALITAAS